MRVVLSTREAEEAGAPYGMPTPALFTSVLHDEGNRQCTPPVSESFTRSKDFHLPVTTGSQEQYSGARGG